MNRVQQRRYRPSTHGFTLIYTVVCLAVLCAFCSLAVDFGRVQLAKTELRRAADGAARAGAASIPEDLNDAIRFARYYAAQNKVDGQSLDLDANKDIEFVKWDPKTATSKRLKSSELDQANAIHVTARRNAARGNAIPVMFMSLLGFNSCDIHADAIAMVIPPIDVDQYVPATANPFLSGMPKGSVASKVNPHNNPDYAGSKTDPKQAPTPIGMSVFEGETLTFDNISGDARHDPGMDYYEPDGQLNDIGHNNLTTSDSNSKSNTYYNENGIADMKAPINALVGVFLNDDAPSTQGTPPKNLDFTTPQSRDFDTLKPELRQIFFIGDGLNSTGNHQNFIAPPGATRLFLATWDFYEWNNNAGYRNIKINRPTQIFTVK